MTKGLPKKLSGNVLLGSFGSVEIDNLPTDICQILINNIHYSETREKFFGKPIYCRAVRNLTPEKNLTQVNSTEDNEVTMNARGPENDQHSDASVDSPVKSSHDRLQQQFVFQSVGLTKGSKFFRKADNISSNESEDDLSENELLKKHCNASKMMLVTGTPEDRQNKKRHRNNPTNSSDKKLRKKNKT